MLYALQDMSLYLNGGVRAVEGHSSVSFFLPKMYTDSTIDFSYTCLNPEIPEYNQKLSEKILSQEGPLKPKFSF